MSVATRVFFIDRESYFACLCGRLTAGIRALCHVDQTLAVAERALALSPNHYYVNKMVASVYQRRGAYAQALIFIQRALESSPNDDERIRSLAIANELQRRK